MILRLSAVESMAEPPPEYEKHTRLNFSETSFKSVFDNMAAVVHCSQQFVETISKDTLENVEADVISDNGNIYRVVRDAHF